jgi:hypothetical protein
VRIERDRVRARDPRERRAAAFGERRKAAVRSVDMRHAPYLAATAARSASGSTAPVFVVPPLAQTKNGRRPARSSAAIAPASVSGSSL